MFLFMKRVAETTQVSVTRDEIDLSDEGEIHHDEEKLNLPPSVEVYEIDGPFFFGIANKFDDIMNRMGDKPPASASSECAKSPSWIPPACTTSRASSGMSHSEHIHIILSGVNDRVRAVCRNPASRHSSARKNVCSNINEAVAKAWELSH